MSYYGLPSLDDHTHSQHPHSPYIDSQNAFRKPTFSNIINKTIIDNFGTCPSMNSFNNYTFRVTVVKEKDIYWVKESVPLKKKGKSSILIYNYFRRFHVIATGRK